MPTKEYGQGNNDEYKTPKEAVVPIMAHLPWFTTVWCPFDTKDSNYVKVLSRAIGFDGKPIWNVLYSHKDTGQDFFEYEPEDWDIIVSNPPFTNKREFFERALSFNKPFALLMTNQWLNDAAPKRLFKKRPLQLMMFDDRVHFEQNGETRKDTPFSCSYFCCDLLPQQIVMANLAEIQKSTLT